ncbi:MAG: hypothetical protein ABIP54_04120 [Candidatus Andersenbacteria bacterium]
MPSFVEVMRGLPRAATGYGNYEDAKKQYGPHGYTEEGTCDCAHGCTCFLGASQSGGPVGVDPLNGECPGNPADGQFLGELRDYAAVVTRRIQSLERALSDARRRLEQVAPEATELAEKLSKANARINALESAVRSVKEGLDKVEV